MQFLRSRPEGPHAGEYQALQPSIKTTEGRGDADVSGHIKPDRMIVRMVARILLMVSWALAALSLERHIKSDTLFTEVRSECYGRYEMCLEMSWKGNQDIRPYPGDDYFFAMSIIDRNEMLVEAVVGETWADLCQSDKDQRVTDAPWYCPCLEDLHFRCYRIHKDPILDTDNILGFYTRSTLLTKALRLADVSMWTMLAAQVVGAVYLMLLVMILRPWKQLGSKVAAVCSLCILIPILISIINPELHIEV